MAYFVWDGLTFFDFDSTKLEVLKGKKVFWYSKFKSLRWIMMNLMVTVLILFFIFYESGKYGNQVCQTLSFYP